VNDLIFIFFFIKNEVNSMVECGEMRGNGGEFNKQGPNFSILGP
jgi:hypothetical protein